MPRSSGSNPPAPKTCSACGRPFAWRKKWEKVWDEVRYCSDACRSGRYAAAKRQHASPTPREP